jgi:hypothetical protein
MALIGMYGYILINGTQYDVENWKVQNTNDLQDVTDTGSLGETVRIPGVNSGTLTCSMWYNQSSPQPAVLTEGLLILFVGKVGNTSQTYTRYYYISDVTVENSAKNPVKVDITALSTAAGTPPSPPVTSSSSSSA